MIEFLLAGGETLHAMWPNEARRAGVLLCKTDHDGICSSKIGCSMGDFDVRFNVIPIVSVQGFDCNEYGCVLLLTPSKKNLNVEVGTAKSTLRNVLISLQELGVKVFESQTMADQRVWVEFR